MTTIGFFVNGKVETSSSLLDGEMKFTAVMGEGDREKAIWIKGDPCDIRAFAEQIIHQVDLLEG